MSESLAKSEKSFELNRAWIEWLEKNIGLGVPQSAIIEAMIRNGCDSEFAEKLVNSFVITEAGIGNPSSRLEKVRWLLNSLRSMRDISPANKIAERASVNSAEFFDFFYRGNVPVIYRGGITPSELRDQLAFEKLLHEFGGMEVEVQEGRSSRSDYEWSSNELKSRARLADFLQRAQSAVESNDFYMTANNSSANTSLIASAIRSEEICPELLDGSKAHGRIFLWIGPRGTFTPAHHDLTNNLFLQVHGSKEVRLASSLALLEVDNDRHCYLTSSLLDHDEARRVKGLEPLSVTVTLIAGDVLFIPLGWWHEVRSLSPSISLSATNFRAGNDFHRSYNSYGRLD